VLKVVVGIAALASFVFIQSALAQPTTEAYPNRPVRLIVTYPPGAVADGVARILTHKLAAVWGQQVVIDNRPGGSGVIGMNALLKSKPDGYTFGLVLANQAIFALLHNPPPYDIERDSMPISLVAEYPFLLLVNRVFPATTVSQFIEVARGRPNQITFASSGNGSGPHLAIELLNMMAKLKLVHVPYKGGSLALTDVAGGHVDAFFASLLSAKPLMSAGKIRAIGVTSPKRFSQLPDVPSFTEVLPGFAATGWAGLIVPAGTPQPVIDNIGDAVARYVREPEGRDRLSANGLEPRGSTPAEFRDFLRSETVKYRKVVATRNIRADE
jgi:tripartite-type tricarboxylate transporter receptor subunit TctC